MTRNPCTEEFRGWWKWWFAVAGQGGDSLNYNPAANGCFHAWLILHISWSSDHNIGVLKLRKLEPKVTSSNCYHLRKTCDISTLETANTVVL